MKKQTAKDRKDESKGMKKFDEKEKKGNKGWPPKKKK